MGAAMDAILARRSLATVKQIAAEVVGHGGRRLEVVGVTAGEGNGSYAEVLLRDHAGETTQAPMIIIGVARNEPEADLRRQIAERLRPRLDATP
jgi:hypothetical protein